jgi:16S rRNA (guanine(1405)-N(7))-methyltransferase
MVLWKVTMSGLQTPDDKLETIESALARSRRYAGIIPETVRRVAGKALIAAKGDVNEAIKRTKRGLHEIHGAYLPASVPKYDAMLRGLRSAADSGDEEQLRSALKSAMAVHASTHERLPHVESFYRQIFAKIPAPASIRDLACGLNPLAEPWMPRAGPVTYLASDIDRRLVDFVGQALMLLDVKHRVEALDLIEAPVTGYADLTLLLKTVPCLERQKPGAGWNLIDATDSPTIVVTFPTKSLCQRSKGMFHTYSTAFEAHMAERSWHAERMEIPNELIYVVTKYRPGQS